MSYKKSGFTLIELLVVIAIIGLLATIVMVSVNAARAKARETRRLSDVTQLVKIFNSYLSDKNVFPATGGTKCLGVNTGSTCWGDRVVPGSDYLINELNPYIKSIPPDPSPSRGWGDAYLYAEGAPAWHCNGSSYPPGHYIFWRPEKMPQQDRDCLSLGFFACCGSGPCGNNGGYFCAVKMD